MSEKKRLTPPRITGRKVKKNKTKHAHTTITESDAAFLLEINMSVAAAIRFAVKTLKHRKEVDDLINKLYGVKEIDRAVNLKNKKQ